MMVARLQAAAAEVWLSADTPTEQACCVGGRLLLEQLYGREAVARAPLPWWSLDIRGGAPGPWSPAEACARAGVGAEPRDLRLAPPLPGELLYCQGWRGPPLSPGVTGHTFVWLPTSGTLGWQYDVVVGRSYDARVRPWGDVVGEFRGGIRGSVLRSVLRQRA